jgi:EpsI family protein
MRKLALYVPAAILLVGCGLVYNVRSQVAAPLAGPIKSVMAEAAGYEVTDQTIDPKEQRVAGMTEYVARIYQRDGKISFSTLVSYYDKQSKGKTIHSPRNCLPGAGWEIVQGAIVMLNVDGKPRPVNRYVLKNRNAMAIAYYWYQGRGRVTANEYAVKWNLLRDAALRGRTEEALVRVVVPVAATTQLSSGTTGGVFSEDGTAQSVATRLMTEVEGILPRAGGD